MKRWAAGFLLALAWLLCAKICRAEGTGIFLRLEPTTKTSFSNAIPHYVYFNAETKNVEKLTVRLYKPSGDLAAFRTRKHVDTNRKAVTSAQYALKDGLDGKEDLNILFRSETDTGIWRIEVTATAAKQKPVTQILEVEIREPLPLELGQLGEVHAMLIGEDGDEALPAEEGKIRFVAQNPKDPSFVKEYWLSKKYDLREKSNKKCTRAVFSMALSYLGIDCTPVRMSDLLWGEEIIHTFDPVCEKLGNVERISGDLDTLWAAYEAGEASPVLVHFDYESGEGMHSLLLVSRDRLNPELFYCVTSSSAVNTSAFPDGKVRDHVIPILIEEGRIGAWIQSPLLKAYHKGKIDDIWQWTRTDIP